MRTRQPRLRVRGAAAGGAGAGGSEIVGGGGSTRVSDTIAKILRLSVSELGQLDVRRLQLAGRALPAACGAGIEARFDPVTRSRAPSSSWSRPRGPSRSSRYPRGRSVRRASPGLINYSQPWHVQAEGTTARQVRSISMKTERPEGRVVTERQLKETLTRPISLLAPSIRRRPDPTHLLFRLGPDRGTNALCCTHRRVPAMGGNHDSPGARTAPPTRAAAPQAPVGPHGFRAVRRSRQSRYEASPR